MIIRTKSRDGQAGPPQTNKYAEFGQEAASRLPVYLSMLFGGLFAYFRELISSSARASEDRASGHEPSLPQGRHGSHHAGAAPRGDSAAAGTADQDDRPRHPHASIWDDIAISDAPAFAYPPGSRYLSGALEGYFPAAFSIRPSNDNAIGGHRSADEIETPQNWDEAAAWAGLRKSAKNAAAAAAAQPETAPGSLGGSSADARTDTTAGAPAETTRPEPVGGTAEPVPRANRRPSASGPVSLNDIFAGQAVLIGVLDLLTGASDPDGDPLTVTGLHASRGDLAAIENGWIYRADPATAGPVSFSFELDDGKDKTPQTASVNVLAATEQLTSDGDTYAAGPDNNRLAAGSGDDDIDAGAGDDEIWGDDGNDIINGSDGGDVLHGGRGGDILFGGAGSDRLYGDDGDDQLYGGDGSDMLLGGTGNDVLSGDDGDDDLQGGDGDDRLDGGEGDDRLGGGNGNDALTDLTGNNALSGGAGDDVLSAGEGNDTLAGDAGDDWLDGGEGDDDLDGGDGDDTLAGGGGTNVVSGGAGDDVIVDGNGDDAIDGGPGNDTLDLSRATLAVAVDLIQGTVTGDDVGRDAIADFETILGGSGDDAFVVGVASMVLTGGLGNDLFAFFPGPTGSDHVHQDHEITDFAVGDRIEVPSYRLHERLEPDTEARFDSTYADTDSESDLPIRIRDERFEDLDYTIIETALNSDGGYEITISLHGHHMVIVEQAIA